jgi:transcription elongation factor Elf1
MKHKIQTKREYICYKCGRFFAKSYMVQLPDKSGIVHNHCKACAAKLEARRAKTDELNTEIPND